MKMISAPLVYAGSTLSAEHVQTIYPGCIVRPPIARGDLYRDRMLRGAVFVILDGVFFQDQAVSPREIVDVIADGALVVGAASMGALRAAECWPAGMRGVGAIYRLFRSGALESDDEVAVAFSTSETARVSASSVALINVRYALRCGVRARLLEPTEADRILRAAVEMFYADRYWPLILRAAGIAKRPQLAAALAAYDLKAADARRALERVRRWVRETPSLLERPRAKRTGFTRSEESRERDHDAMTFWSMRQSEVESEPAIPSSPLRIAFAEWAFATGRASRYAVQLTAANDGQAPQASSSRLRSFVADPSTQAEALWLALSAAHELDAELFRFQAQLTAAARSVAAGTEPTARDRHMAEHRSATQHRFHSWAALLEALADCPAALALVLEHSRQAALAQAAVRSDFARAT